MLNPLFIISLKIIGEPFYPQKSGKFEICYFSKNFSPNIPYKIKSYYHQKKYQKSFFQYSNCFTLAMSIRFLVEQNFLSRNLSIV